MTGVIAATAVVGIGGALLSAGAQKNAARQATESQERATQMTIAEQRRQFDKLQKLLGPFAARGEEAGAAQGALVGLGGPGEEQAAIDAIRGGPEFQSLVRQGEEGILQNASATGGLRGGDTQGALAQFRPQILSSLINQRFGRLGNIAQLGQASAAGVGSAGLQTGQNIGNALINQGEAQAQGALARGTANANLFGDITSSLGTLLSNKKFTDKIGF